MDVSVVIPAYNVERYITKAIDSVLQDSDLAIEIIVVDDGSVDRTAEVVEEARRRDPRVRLVRQSSNVGPSACRNRGIGEATGKYVAFVDADDWCAPGRLDRLVEVARATGADVVSDNLHLIDEEATRPWTDAHTEFGVAYGKAEPVRQLEFIRKGWVVQPIVDREVLVREGLCFDPDVEYGEDYILYVELLMRGCRWVVCDVPMYYYVARAGSITHSDKIPRDLLRYLGDAAERARLNGRVDLERAFRYRRARIGASVALWGFTARSRDREYFAAASAAVRMVRYAPVYAERFAKLVDRYARKRRAARA